MTLRKTLHDEQHNEDYYYESERGNIWHIVEPEEQEREDEDEQKVGEDQRTLEGLRLIGRCG